MENSKIKSLLLWSLGLLLLSWVFFGASYLVLWYELKIVYFPLILATIALFHALLSLIVTSIGLLKGKSIILNFIILVAAIATTLVLFIFLKAYSFFAAFSG